jgi:hypothetical protein
MSNEDFVWRQDVESGEWYQIRREEAEEIEAMRKRIASMAAPGVKGQIIIMSTGVSDDKQDDMRDIWNQINSKP